MNRIAAFLKRIGILPAFTVDDVLNASTEDALRTHERAVEAMSEVTQKRVEGNEALRRSLRLATRRTNSFAEFERRFKEMRH